MSLLTPDSTGASASSQNPNSMLTPGLGPGGMLTPDSTGSTTSAIGESEPPVKDKSARRKTRLYTPGLTPNYDRDRSQSEYHKPFSRSAAKRSSVMALGSIEHLQYYFARTGIDARRDPKKNLRGLVPALGGMQHVRNMSSVSGPSTPTGLVPTFLLNTSDDNGPNGSSIEQVTNVDDETSAAWADAATLLPGVVSVLDEVERVWTLGGEETDAEASFDVLNALKATTRAVRGVRNYVVALPDVDDENMNANAMVQIRKRALDVLTVLRALEERCRIEDGTRVGSPDPSSLARVDSPSARVGSPGPVRVGSPSSSSSSSGSDGLGYSLVQVQGRVVPVWVWEDDNDTGYPQEADEEEKRRWDETISRGGWLYRDNVRLGEVVKEKEVVGAYLEVVDEVLFGGGQGEEGGGARGWTRFENKGGMRRRSVRREGMGVLEEGIFEEPEEHDSGEAEEEDLPAWARTRWEGDELSRAYALLRELLPDSYSLPESSDRTAFLDTLSNGQLLCMAYNVGVRRSPGPWGYVPKDRVHDVLSLSQSKDKDKEKGGWTFRRTENLRLWAGALKLRYCLPIASPQPPSSSVQSHTSSTLSAPSRRRSQIRDAEQELVFDASVVARKDDAQGWDRMLEGVLGAWVACVVAETRDGGSTRRR